MEVGSLIKVTLDALKKRLDDNDTLTIQGTDGYLSNVKCTFKKGLEQEVISEFEKTNDLELPSDLKQFYLLSNGMHLFEEEYAGGIRIYPLQKLKKFPPEIFDDLNYLPIGDIDNVGYVLIHKGLAKQPFSNYLYFLDAALLDPPEKLNLNFELWLELIILAQGNIFWDWKYYTAENSYRLR
ncbi:SMI1/KNR4 family protein [Halalkalibacterium halodurans]|jgi:hypothetical protein|uniref:SMI1/KNR4 family protein n=2 Tax=Halalkalibacterium halodurans TaxID=86665 RepID=UPI002E1C22DB|nr:SMI1/KNR4 family protein [Halalkalibacterium halodurans]MED4086928.1 SMI1/KNR4 family protein [Halalkalibacterium halodurans]MED4107075.1 SMI1/KNR4 family protein [Halalkalibacterium halodurans]MED4110609.1 SMI1/KNR4 family protein [Halalkalibacterium halodurans]MED4151011.1 SMI1/KNR4 family protein [Halalkalibacterium halodurans]